MEKEFPQIEDLKIEPKQKKERKRRKKPKEQKEPIKKQEKEEKPQEQIIKVQVPKFDVLSGKQQIHQDPKDLEDFRQNISKQITAFEGVLFKGITGKPLDTDETDMLYNGWYGITKEYINDLPSGKTMAILMLALAHGTIILVHKDELINGIKKKKTPKPSKPIQHNTEEVQNVTYSMDTIESKLPSDYSKKLDTM